MLLLQVIAIFFLVFNLKKEKVRRLLDAFTASFKEVQSDAENFAAQCWEVTN